LESLFHPSATRAAYTNVPLKPGKPFQYDGRENNTRTGLGNLSCFSSAVLYTSWLQHHACFSNQRSLKWHSSKSLAFCLCSLQHVFSTFSFAYTNIENGLTTS
jgi:hypothetical protein